MQCDAEHLRIKVFAVIDTNVLLSFTEETSGIDTAVKQIGRLVESGNIIPLFDERMLSEYYAVLNYKKFQILPEIVENRMNLILSNGVFVKDVKEIEMNFKDETDIPFYEVTLSTTELDSQLVTGNTRHYPEGSTVTPKMLIQNMHYIEEYFGDFLSEKYDEQVQKKIVSLTNSEKYHLGNKLPEAFIQKIKEARLKPREHIDLNEYLDI